jgi:hypothetical protein
VFLLLWSVAPQWQHVDITKPLDKKDFGAVLHRYPLVVINFYAPWCPFCRRMEPSWEAATQAVHNKYTEETDGRIRFAKVSGLGRRVSLSLSACVCKEHNRGRWLVQQCVWFVYSACYQCCLAAREKAGTCKCAGWGALSSGKW